MPRPKTADTRGPALAGGPRRKPADPAQDRHLSVFGDIPVSNGWEDVFLAPGDLEFRDGSLVGVAYGRGGPTR
ncbi:hypothetical protein [Rhodovulum sp. ES.010]|uniref:hypothetical protein n=1 Tax=Rhodovulum sp. ES.010 TaxID=1882821 RepID=UPI00111539E3|nr:hypothetical protein [Rhodovulum sp. ES.010]